MLGYGIAVDAAGNAYVTGRTDSTNFPTDQPLAGHAWRADDKRLRDEAERRRARPWSTPPTSAAAAVIRGNGIAVDAAGNAYVTGVTSSTNFPTTNPFQATFGGGSRRLRDEAERGGLGPGLLHLPRRQRR